MSRYDRLPPIDSSFLYAESPCAHMHVASLAIFDEPQMGESEIVKHIEDRLALVPRYRQKVAWVPGNQGRPVWVDDTRFDIRNHVLFTGAKVSNERDVLRLAARLFSRPLDRSRPLWEMWFIRMTNGRVGIVTKSHHCLVDGISALDIGTAMLDFSSDAPQSATGARWMPEPEPHSARLLYDALRDRVAQPVKVARGLVSAARSPKAHFNHAKDVLRGVASYARASIEMAPRASFTKPIGPHRRFEIVRADLSAVKAIRAHHDCTVNDVVLAAVTGGLRKLLRSRKECVDNLVLKAMVPVSFRSEAERNTYGNRVSCIVADLPVGEEYVDERVRKIHARTTRLKASKQALGADFWFKLSDYAPPSVLALAGRAAPLQRAVNVIVTNIPGPQFPLFFRGGSMLEAFPVVPIFGVASLGVAVLSYNGKVTFGLNADWSLFPDIDRLAEGIAESIDELAERATRPEPRSSPEVSFAPGHAAAS